ncbi:MAG: 23S rRNA (pseudouridine(1915)-N(3))-methyltransferase RlmH [Chitinophagaceae bacterium]|nr:23S rRNA (pseudouridine(1915)-N(3))-methyltransferase RlmH [Chitinophagaceae bacterium]
MTIELWSLGKENTKLVDAAIEEYTKRIQHYVPYKLTVIDNAKIPKQLPKAAMMEKEAELVLQKLQDRDLLVVLDEHGKAIQSMALAEKMNHMFNLSPNRIIFLIGGSFGIAPVLKEKAHYILSLSSLTFPHQLVRLLFTEQLYRALSILKNEKYHHE